MALFSKKIKCVHCGGNFKSKMQRGKRIYICSRYDNHNDCTRVVIDEGFLIELLDKRFGNDLTVEEKVHKVGYVEVEEKYKFAINFKDVGEIPIIFGDNMIQY